LSVVILTTSELRLMVGAERLCHMFEWGSRDEKGRQPLI